MMELQSETQKSLITHTFAGDGAGRAEYHIVAARERDRSLDRHLPIGRRLVALVADQQLRAQLALGGVGLGWV